MADLCPVVASVCIVNEHLIDFFYYTQSAAFAHQRKACSPLFPIERSVLNPHTGGAYEWHLTNHELVHLHVQFEF